MIIRKWQKGDKYVEIEECHSIDIKGPALIVSSNAFPPGQIPIEWREQVPLSDKQGCQRLTESVRRWAESHGYAPDYGEMTRDYLIAEEGTILWDLIRMDLDWLEHFRATLEKLIEERETRDIAAVENRYYSWHWQDIIGTQLRQSYIVALMSGTERYLVQVCSDVGAIRGTPIDLGDFTRGTVAHAREFLTKNAAFSTPVPATWVLVAGVYRLRNIVVHNGGILNSANKARVSEFVRQTQAPGLKFESASVEIMREFCQFAHKRIAEFFNELRGEYAALCRNRCDH